jgi:hypothetical protein
MGVRGPDFLLRKLLGYHLGRAGGWQGHRKGQLRVLGSPSTLRAKEPAQDQGGTGGGGVKAGSPRTRFFLAKGAVP